jgi:hypothetical protein
MARAGRLLLDGRLSHLATLLVSGAPRTIPVMADVTDSHLFVFLDPELAAVKDLVQDGRYALHAVIDSEGEPPAEFWVAGHASEVFDPALWARAEGAAIARGYPPKELAMLFELTVEHAALDEGGVRSRWVLDVP